MTIRAGASLPGPFFISFPIAGPALGIIGIAVLPFAFVIWIGINLFIGLGWLIGKTIQHLVIPAAGAAVEATEAAITEARHQRREHLAVPSNRPGLTPADRALLRKLGM